MRGLTETEELCLRNMPTEVPDSVFDALISRGLGVWKSTAVSLQTGETLSDGPYWYCTPLGELALRLNKLAKG